MKVRWNLSRLNQELDLGKDSDDVIEDNDDKEKYNGEELGDDLDLEI